MAKKDIIESDTTDPVDVTDNQPAPDMAEEPEAAAAVPAAVPRVKKKKKHRRPKARSAERVEKAKPAKKPSRLWIVGIILLVVAAALAIFIWKLNSHPGPAQNGNWSGNAVVITEYSDFQCPFCKRAEDTMIKLKETYGDKIRIDYKHYPLPFHVNAEISAEASECSRDQGKFQEYHDLLFKMSQPDGTGLAKADHLKYAQQLGLDVAKFTACLDSGEKKAVVAAQQAEGQAKGVSGTPAFFISGEFISGAQPIEVFIPVIDKALGKPVEEVGMIVLTDKNCGAGCDPTQLTARLKQIFFNVNVKQVDVNTDEGKALVQKYKAERVPTFLFDNSVTKTAGYTQYKTAFVTVDDKVKIVDEATGATHFVDPVKEAAYQAALLEAKKKAMEKLGIGTKPQVDFFVMSYCPYGNQAEEAIAGAYKVLGDLAAWKPRYVVYSNYQGGGPTYCMDDASKFCSMHGVQEMHEDVRELCVEKEYGTAKVFSFLLAMNAKCTAQNADTCWTDVAKNLSLDTDKVAACQKDEGTALAQRQLELDQLLSVQGSPTVFINGGEYSGPRTAEGFLAAVCATFKDKPEECSKVPEPTNTTVPAGGCGA